MIARAEVRAKKSVAGKTAKKPAASWKTALVHRVSVPFALAVTRERTAVYGTLQGTALEELLGASPCLPNRHRPKFRSPEVGLPGLNRPSCT
jgi:hypothetical protein